MAEARADSDRQPSPRRWSAPMEMPESVTRVSVSLCLPILITPAVQISKPLPRMSPCLSARFNEVSDQGSSEATFWFPALFLAQFALSSDRLIS